MRFILILKEHFKFVIESNPSKTKYAVKPELDNTLKFWFDSMRIDYSVFVESAECDDGYDLQTILEIDDKDNAMLFKLSWL